MTHSLLRFSFAAGLCLAVLSVTPAVRGQAPAADKEPATAKVPEFRVFVLKRPLAKEAEMVIRQLLGNPDDVKIVGDQEGRLWVSGTPEQVKTVDQILKVMEQPVPKKAQDIKIFPLENAEAASAAELLAQLYPDVPIAVDQRTNSLVVTAGEEQTDVIEAIVQRLDAQPQAQPVPDAKGASTYQVELFWLVESSGKADDTDGQASRKPDSRLTEVVQELNKQGFQMPRQWGQAQVSAKSGSHYKINSSSSIGWFEASGMIREESEQQLVLSCNLRVEAIRAGLSPSAQVTTEVITQAGHNVIICVAGATGDDRRSAFVIRVER